MTTPLRLKYDLHGTPYDVPVEDERVLIGRHEECGVGVPDASVSRRHAAIERHGDDWLLVDLGSRNGVFVNNDPISRHKLRNQDRILLGRVEFTVVLPEAEHALTVMDTDTALSIDGSLDVHHFRDTLTSARSEVFEAIAADPETRYQTRTGKTNEWVTALFSKAAESLLSSVTLRDTLETVLDLVFDSVPAQRGCIYLYDADTDTRTLQVSRTAEGVRDSRFTISETITDQAIREHKAVIVSDSLNDEMYSQQQSIVINNIRSLMCAPLVSEERVVGLIYVDTRNIARPFRQDDLELLTSLGLLAAISIQQEQLRESILQEKSVRQRLERYSAPSVVDRIVQETEMGTSMLAEDLDASVLFLDIVNFTGMSEDLDPLVVVEILNDVFDDFTDCIFDYEGTLDKFTGDGLMAVFGAPLRVEDSALRAVRAAQQMRDLLPDVNKSLAADVNLDIRIGVATGRVIAGDIGSPRRKDFTVVGDTVNVASRLESKVARPNEIIVCGRTLNELQGAFQTEDLGEIPLKGKRLTTRCFRILGPA